MAEKFIQFNIEDLEETTSAILIKYGLEDFSEETIAKIEKGDPFIIPGEIILDLAREIIAKKITQNELPQLIEKQLGLPSEKAVLLAKDIQEKIIPYGQEVEPHQEVPAEKIVSTDIPAVLSLEKESLPDNDIEPVPDRPEKVLPKQSIETSIPPTHSGPDTYREPIE